MSSQNTITNGYTPVYSSEYEKNMFLDDFDYDRKIENLRMEETQYYNEIQKLRQEVKENPTYENLTNYDKLYKVLSSKKQTRSNMRNLLRNCKLIETKFQDFYNDEFKSQQEFEKNISYYIDTFKPFVQCKPYLQHKFGRKLNIDFSNSIIYDSNTKKELILNKKTCGFNNRTWWIKHDFKNGYYYTMTDTFKPLEKER